MDTAKAKPKPGVARHPPYMTSIGQLNFPITNIFSAFRHKKSHFLTLKCNKGKRYQSIDSVRHLMARCYETYVIVGSPTNGQHWHILAAGLKKTLKVPRGVHKHMSTVGRLNVSVANRKPNENPLQSNSSLYSQLRYVRDKESPVVVSDGKLDQLSCVIMYMFENLLENKTKSKYGHLAMRI